MLPVDRPDGPIGLAAPVAALLVYLGGGVALMGHHALPGFLLDAEVVELGAQGMAEAVDVEPWLDLALGGEVGGQLVDHAPETVFGVGFPALIGDQRLGVGVGREFFEQAEQRVRRPDGVYLFPLPGLASDVDEARALPSRWRLVDDVARRPAGKATEAKRQDDTVPTTLAS